MWLQVEYELTGSARGLIEPTVLLTRWPESVEDVSRRRAGFDGASINGAILTNG